MWRKTGAAMLPPKAAAALMTRRRVGAAPTGKDLLIRFPLIGSVVVEMVEAGPPKPEQLIGNRLVRNIIALHHAPVRVACPTIRRTRNGSSASSWNGRRHAAGTQTSRGKKHSVTCDRRYPPPESAWDRSADHISSCCRVGGRDRSALV